MDRTNLSIMTTALHVAARTATLLPEPVRFERCAGCGRERQLLRVDLPNGRYRWMQGDHSCDEEKALWR